MDRSALGFLLGVLFASPAGAAFSETQRLQSFHPQVGEDYGLAVAVAGDTGVVCAPRRNLGNGNFGECILYRLIGGTWTTDGVLLASAPGLFGTSVAISGDRIVVGAPTYNVLPGHAFVFRRVAPGSWVEEAVLAPWHGEDTPFGTAVAIDGDVIAVGAPGEIDEAGAPTNPGAVYVFRRSGFTWPFEQKLVASSSSGLDNLGTAVAVDGDALVAGAPEAFLFFEFGNNHWQQRQFEPAPPPPNRFAGFQGTLALQGNVLFVGGHAPGAYLYQRSGNRFDLIRLLEPSAPSGTGAGVALAGTTLVLGRRGGSVPDGTHPGSAHVYRAGPGGWVEEETLVGSLSVDLGWFGVSVATDGIHLLVGASIAAEAYMFEETNGLAPPTAHAGSDASLECTGPAGAPVTLDGSASSDPDSTPGTNDDIVAFEWLEGATALGSGEVLQTVLPLGSHTITLRVSDGDGLADEDTVVVHVVDTVPLALTVSLSPAMLWPPNHRLVDVTATLQVTGACGPTSVTLESVTSDEPDDAPGGADGNTTNDVQDASTGSDDRVFRLRSERIHGESGESRIYTATYLVEEIGGGSVTASGTAVVPMFQNGVVDPIFVRLTETPSGTQVGWTPADEGAHTYNVIQGRVQDLTSTQDDYTLGAVQCIEYASLDTNTAGFEHGQVPSPGEAFFYAVEYDDVSYGAESAAKPRAVLAGDCP